MACLLDERQGSPMRPLLFAFKNVSFAACLILILTACFLLFASPDGVAGMGLEFPHPFDRKVLLIALIACATAYATYLDWVIGQFIGTELDRRPRRNALIKTLLNLSGEEKQLIREFIRDDKT